MCAPYALLHANTLTQFFFNNFLSRNVLRHIVAFHGKAPFLLPRTYGYHYLWKSDYLVIRQDGRMPATTVTQHCTMPQGQRKQVTSGAREKRSALFTL